MGTPGAELPSHGPVLERPTLHLLLGSVSEVEIGRFGSAERVQAEARLTAGFLETYRPHLLRGGASRPGVEGQVQAGWLFTFHSGDAHTQVRMDIVDAGCVDLQLPGREHALSVRVRQGPPRLSTRLVRVIVTGLHEDLMVQGVVASLLESAGYSAGGEQGFVVRSEHAGEHRGEISAIAPDLGRCGVIVGVVRPPPTDLTLSLLPPSFQDTGSGGVVRVSVSYHHPVVPPPPTSAPLATASPSASGPPPAPSPGTGSIPTASTPNPPPALPLLQAQPHPPTLPPPMTSHASPHQQPGRRHPAMGYQPSSTHLPLPPPPPPPRLLRTHRLISPSRSVRRRLPTQGRAHSTSHRPYSCPHARSSHIGVTLLPGFVAATEHSPPLQHSIFPPLTRALDPILDLGAHLPRDTRGIGRFPDPPPRGSLRARPGADFGTVGSRVGRPDRLAAGRLDRLAEGRADRPAGRQPFGREIVDHDMGVLSAPPPGFLTPSHLPRTTTQVQPMDIDEGSLGGAGPSQALAGNQEIARTAPSSPSATPAQRTVSPTDPAVSSRMDIDRATTPPPLGLPDQPLTEACMAWLEDNEDPTRTIEERRQHLRRLLLECPSVFSRHAQDGSNPPPPEVRTALRELGGLLPAEGADDPMPSYTSPPLSAPPAAERSVSLRRRGVRPNRDSGPAASAGKRSRQPPGTWYVSPGPFLPPSSSPSHSQPATRSQPARQTAPPSGSRRRGQ